MERECPWWVLPFSPDALCKEVIYIRWNLISWWFFLFGLCGWIATDGLDCLFGREAVVVEGDDEEATTFVPDGVEG